MSLVNPSRQVWAPELVTLDQNPPVLNTLHEVFNYSGGVRLHTVHVYQTNTPTNQAEVDVLITLADGTTILYDGSAVNVMDNAIDYAMHVDLSDAVTATLTDSFDARNGDATILERMPATAPYAGTSIESESIKLEIRQTSAIDAGARIRVSAFVERLRSL